ncbi:uncharacterized protein LOC131177946 [Hevea brasiliensis]|uniref:uncharacterized protein LOC131177946 n=1 Tax=Hevea brasiliensis TaxID=3981 RepID=UPI0025E007C0|nr:uncharacterized protein LOC131177946 [Hevea brasiliensis]
MPQESWHKLNVDGGVKGVNGWVLGGGLIRNSKGHRINLVESDGMELVKMVNDNSLDACVPSNFKYILNEVRKLLSHSWKIVMINVLREANMCANWLSSFAANVSQGVVLMKDPPDGLRC